MTPVMITLLQTLNSFTPLGLAALLALVLWRQAGHQREIRSMRNNDLHEFPDLIEKMSQTLAALQRIEVGLATLLERTTTLIERTQE